jgi:hypothetical protein
MGSLFYTLAKSYVEKRDAKEKKQRDDRETARKAERDKFVNMISDFKKRYIDDVVTEFKETINPEFEVGEIATTNWYGEGSSWDGNMRMLQAHTPFKGPIDVEITQIVLDYAEIYEIIDKLIENDEFNNKYTDWAYTSLKQIVDAHRRQYDISWAYMIKVPNDENKYWCYAFRENKLLKRKSDVAKWSRKCFENELEASKLYEEKRKLDEKIRKQLERITKTKIIVR